MSNVLEENILAHQPVADLLGKSEQLAPLGGSGNPEKKSGLVGSWLGRTETRGGGSEEGAWGADLHRAGLSWLPGGSPGKHTADPGPP